MTSPTVTILGSNAAIPAHNRGLSAQVLQAEDRSYLIDCGEGTQFAMIKHKVRFSRIHQIFISHLHGDHLFGLPGLLSTFAVQGRKEKLSVFGPPGIEAFLNEVFSVSNTHIPYEIRVNIVDTGKAKDIFDDGQFSVRAIPLDHRVPAVGFLFREAKKRNMRTESIREYKLDHHQVRDLLSGRPVRTGAGLVLQPDEHTYVKHKPLSYAYIPDTRPVNRHISELRGVDLLFHEATYLGELSDMARERFHSTAAQAARQAAACGAGRLIIGHFSSRYRELISLLEEARSIFPKTYAGLDGSTFSLSAEEFS